MKLVRDFIALFSTVVKEETGLSGCDKILYINDHKLEMKTGNILLTAAKTYKNRLEKCKRKELVLWGDGMKPVQLAQINGRYTAFFMEGLPF